MNVAFPWVMADKYRESERKRECQRERERKQISNVGFVTVHGLNKGHIAPYTDIEFHLAKNQTYIMMNSQAKSLQLIFQETITLLTEIKHVKQMALKQYFTTW